MDSDIQTWLYDILQSISEIDSYFEGKPKRFDDYVKDIKTKRAVERDFEIIGEAVNRILRKDVNFYLENAQRIIGAYWIIPPTAKFLWVSIIVNFISSLILITLA